MHDSGALRREIVKLRQQTMRLFKNEVGVCAKRSRSSLRETHSSCPDLIHGRPSIFVTIFSKKMDHRVKPGDDDLGAFQERLRP